MSRAWDLWKGTHRDAGWEEKRKGYACEDPRPRVVGYVRRIGSV